MDLVCGDYSHSRMVLCTSHFNYYVYGMEQTYIFWLPAGYGVPVHATAVRVSLGIKPCDGNSLTEDCYDCSNFRQRRKH